MPEGETDPFRNTLGVDDSSKSNGASRDSNGTDVYITGVRVGVGVGVGNQSKSRSSRSRT